MWMSCRTSRIRHARAVLSRCHVGHEHVNSFAEVLLARHMGGGSMVNPPQQLDYERFGNDMLLDFYKAESDAIEAICPGKPWYMMEHSTSAVQWKPLNTRKRAGELMRDSLAHVAMGADAISFFQWRQSASGAESFHSAMVPHAGGDTKLFRGICELGTALKTLSDAGAQGTELKRADTAILFSAESEWATRSETLPSMKLNHRPDRRTLPHRPRRLPRRRQQTPARHARHPL